MVAMDWGFDFILSLMGPNVASLPLTKNLAPIPHHPLPTTTRFTLASVAETIVAQEEAPPIPQSEKLGVVVKAKEKPRLVLKFIWMEKSSTSCLRASLGSPKSR
ncbi:uncharacterized protein LOC124834943 [Vigna umbellata]|uniref:uncharacterized protein LOC124834943 n=1 Tax=Vigna umbellata TaxID=87088 RepID=UPI001F5EC8A5|nr:uncharacterized protein LOC124834943 [Vigna umbellata]